MRTREPRRAATGYRALRFAALLTSATLLGQLGQLVWLTAGSRVLDPSEYGTVLAAQALYAGLQVVVDTGSAFYGARLAAVGDVPDEERGAIVRTRLELAVAGAAVVVAVGAVGGGRSLAASAPYAVALVAFAALNYWERFGLGDSRPWSAYLVARSFAPAAAAALALVLGAGLPVFVPGLVEVAAVLAVGVAFRLGLARHARLALGADRRAWRTIVLGLSLPAVLLQVGPTSGPVLLNAAGSSAAAGAVAVALRLMTGVSGLVGAGVTALYPRLARTEAGAADAGDARALAVAAAVAVAVCAGALAFVLALAPALTVLFYGRASEVAESAAILVVSSAAATAVALVVAQTLTAKRLERLLVRPAAASVLAGVVPAAVVVAVEPQREALLVAGCVAAGQLVAMLGLVHRAGVLGQRALTALRLAALAAGMLVGVGTAGAVADEARLPLAALVVIVVVAGGALAAVRARPATPAGQG